MGLGNASLILSANDSKLKSDLASAGNEIKSFASRVGSQFTSIFTGGGFSGLAISGPIGVALGSVQSALGGVIDRLGVFGRTMKDATTLGVSGEAFQELTAVMQKAGGDASQTGTYFQGMAKNVFDASQGIGRARIAFQMLGLDAQNLANLSVDQQFLAIAEAIQKLPSAGAQASATLKIFGDTALLPQLQQGRAGIESFLATVRSTGAILSGEQLKEAQEASKAWKSAVLTLQNLWTGLSNQLTLVFAPFITYVAEAFSKFIQWSRPFFSWMFEGIAYLGTLAKATFNLIGDTISEVWGWLKGLFSGFMDLGSYIPKLGDVFDFVFRGIAKLIAYVWDALKLTSGLVLVLVGGLLFSRTLINAGLNAITSFGSSAGGVDRFFDGLRRNQRAAATEQNRVTQAVQATAQAMRQVAEFSSVKAAIIGTQEGDLALARHNFNRTQGNQPNQNEIVRELREVNQNLRRLDREQPEFEVMR